MPKAKNKKRRSQQKKQSKKTSGFADKGLVKTEIFIDNSKDIKEESAVLGERTDSANNFEAGSVNDIGQAVNKDNDHFKIVFSWETVDFVKNRKTQLYLVAAVLGSMGMIVWGITTKSFTMVSMFIMLALVSIMVLNESPQKIRVKVTEEGVDINDDHFSFKDFRSFKITHMHDMEVLNLNRKEKFFPPKMVYVENEPVKDLRDFLEIYLPEEE